MKTIIFSDTHLTTTFDPKLFGKLTKLINSADKVIINGDFWDGYTISFDDFLNSKWNQLFPLLLQKKTIYIYGNHDREEFCDHRTKLFSHQAKEYYTKKISPNKTIVCYHGHQSSPTIDKWFPFLARKPIINRAAIGLMSLGDFIFGKHIWRIKNQKQNLTQFEFAQKNYPGKIVINGHSHLPQKKGNWLNCGMINYGRESYLEINNNKINLVTTNWGKH